MTLFVQGRMARSFTRTTREVMRMTPISVNNKNTSEGYEQGFEEEYE